MPDVWVVNASPLIALAKVGQLGLLEQLADEVLIPEAVASEIFAGPAADPARVALSAGWGARVAPSSVPSVIIEWGLGAGETAVLAVALERGGCTAVLDDASARMCARSLGVALIGTLGVVVRARQRGLITSAASVMSALRSSGLHLDDTIVSSALRHVNETWKR